MVFALAGDSTITRCRPPSPAADAAGFLTAGFLVVGFLVVGFLLVDFAMRHFGGWDELAVEPAAGLVTFFSGSLQWPAVVLYNGDR